ncbi:Tectonin beta-propeller repeat-containing protein 1 [Halocaridina rubra]|uniref:Tectonin beta-propeller repeat-containing protein 1 n=1 Tax=Halocaridina rubra TaxID=373956 RepID=A0AAN8WMR8_HALRR
MPSSQVFAVNNRGRVFSLATDQAVWRELPYLGVEFKRVSTHETAVWALGGDHQIYVYVYGSSVPIRVCEEAYENQRWNPVEGFSSVLLPTDRAPFSSADGLTPRPLTSITLPTLAWSWESPWYLHHTHEGQALDKEAWTYAFDFPRTYTADRKWNSYVRRRKWVRYRRYVALDTWSSVPSIHQDHTQEPFIDISVGGGEVSGGDADKLMVWGVTALGRVMVRKGVDATCPEGCEWVHIATPADQDFTSIWVGRSGRVWAVTWDGCAMIRTGITRDNPTGEDWTVLESPEGSRLLQLAVGVKSVWGLTRDHRIWFRRGLESSPEGVQVKVPSDNKGTFWLLMVGLLNMIAIGPDDQVWGVGKDDHSILVRTGVTEAELTGRTWRSICLPIGSCDSPDQSRSPTPNPASISIPSQTFRFPNTSRSSVQSDSNEISDSPNQSGDLSLQTDPGDMFSMQTAFDHLKLEEKEESQDGHKSDAQDHDLVLEDISSEDQDPESNLNAAEHCADCSLNKTDTEVSRSGETLNSDLRECTNSSRYNLETQVVPNGDIATGSQCEKPCDTNSLKQSDDNFSSEILAKTMPSAFDQKPGASLGSFGTSKEWNEARLRHASGSSAGSESSLVQGSLIIPREDGPSYDLLAMQTEHLWMWVSGGGCRIRANNMPKW